MKTVKVWLFAGLLAVPVLIVPPLAVALGVVAILPGWGVHLLALSGGFSLTGAVWWPFCIKVIDRFANKIRKRPGRPMDGAMLALLENAALNAEKAVVAARRELAQREIEKAQ